MNTSTLTVTPEAAKFIAEKHNELDDTPTTPTLLLEIIGQTGNRYEYSIAFVDEQDLQPGDRLEQHHNIQIVLPAENLNQLQNSRLGYDPDTGGLTFDNPNQPTPTQPQKPPTTQPQKPTEQELTEGPLLDRVQLLVNSYINPAIAAHSGQITVTGIDEQNRAMIVMSGGCQGCSMSAATLQQGVERIIQENLPEITGIVDATDHQAGTTPYYTETGTSPYSTHQH